MNFSIKKMLKKAIKVGSTATIGTGSILSANGGDPIDGFWAGLGSALITCIVNFVSEKIKNTN